MKKTNNIILIFFIIINIFSCNKKEKTYTTYYKNGQIKVNVKMSKDSILDGLGKRYYPSGELKVKTWYHNGINTDSAFFYYKNGIIKKKGFVKNRCQIGWWQHFDSLGKLTKKVEIVEIVKDSTRVSQEIYFKKNMEIDSIKSSFFIIKSKIINDSLLLNFFNNSDYKKYCLNKQHHLCEFIKWAVVINNPCTKRNDTIFSLTNTIEIKICKTNKPIKGKIVDQFMLSDSLPNGLCNFFIVSKDKHFSLNKNKK